MSITAQQLATKDNSQSERLRGPALAQADTFNDTERSLLVRPS